MSDEKDFSIFLTTMSRAMGYRTDNALAQALSISGSTITRWRQGSKPTVEQLSKLSAALGTRLETLLVLAGHLPPGTFPNHVELPPPLDTVTYPERKIGEAKVPLDIRDKLNHYWKRRQREEEERLLALISVVENGPTLTSILGLTQSDLSEHITEFWS